MENLLFDWKELRVEGTTIALNLITIQLTPTNREAACPKVRVLGVDDFALRRGRQAERLGITRFRGYADIEFLRFKTNSLTIVFSDSYKITVFEVAANLTLIAQIIDRLAPRRINHVIE